jgi:hypothetical protein
MFCHNKVELLPDEHPEVQDAQQVDLHVTPQAFLPVGFLPVLHEEPVDVLGVLEGDLRRGGIQEGLIYVSNSCQLVFH